MWLVLRVSFNALKKSLFGPKPTTPCTSSSTSSAFCTYFNDLCMVFLTIFNESGTWYLRSWWKYKEPGKYYIYLLRRNYVELKSILNWIFYEVLCWDLSEYRMRRCLCGVRSKWVSLLMQVIMRIKNMWIFNIVFYDDYYKFRIYNYIKHKYR